MRHLLEASLLVCALALALPAAAQDEGPGVPVEQAAYHVPVFHNDYVALLRVNIPSQRSAGYHIHSLGPDQHTDRGSGPGRPGARPGADTAAPKSARERELHRVFQEGDDAQGQQCRPDPIPQHRHHLAGCAARPLHAGLARRRRLYAADRQ